MESNERQQKIREASQLYYSNGTSPLTDAEFDALLEEERAENPDSELLKVGHGYNISATTGKKVPHKYGLVGSLPKCHNWDEFPKNLKGKCICSTLKLDGLSCAMYYKNGTMYQALTRGDGEIGIDITQKIHRIVPDYTHIDRSFTGAVRGEILMPLNKFEEYSKNHNDAKNPRNTTAGLINAKEISDDLDYLTVVVYSIIGVETVSIYPFPLYPFSDYMSMHKWLCENFSNVVKLDVNCYKTSDEFIEHMNNYREVWYDKYPADGIVITNNDIKFNSGNEGAYVEYSATAFKFKTESAETTIKGIEWNLSKTKYLIPVIQIEPVQLSGTMVKRCSGCNAKMVLDNGWGVGARVSVTKSGEIIPIIKETIIPSSPELPTTCPSCREVLIWEGVHLKCPNPECADMSIQDLLVWCNNLAPVDGLGDTLKIKFFEQLRDDPSIEFNMTVEDIYRIGQLNILGKSVQYDNFCRMFNMLSDGSFPIISALRALNVPRLGDATSELLSHYPEDIKQLMNGVIPYNLDYKIGVANAESVRRHIDKFKRLNYIKDNLNFSENFSNNSRIKVAITGSLEYGSRKDFEKLLNDNGFVLGDLTKDTKYLITNTSDSGSSKNAKADKLGIEKITESDFRKKFKL